LDFPIRDLYTKNQEEGLDDLKKNSKKGNVMTMTLTDLDTKIFPEGLVSLSRWHKTKNFISKRRKLRLPVSSKLKGKKRHSE